MRPKASVIIPCRNEASCLPSTLESIRMQEAGCEVIVVAPDASDDSIPAALAGGARVELSGRAHRAVQLNVGAAASTGDILLFLHADTRLNAGWMEQIERTLRDPSVAGGAFTRRFDSPSTFLRATCALADWRGHLAGWHFGDQAIFTRGALHRRLGGFKEIHPFEDLDYSRRMKAFGKVRTLRPPILGSARRFEKDGPFLRTLKDFGLTLRYLRPGGDQTGRSLFSTQRSRSANHPESSCGPT